MSSATSEEWAAALAVWQGLDEGQRNIALGYLASREPQYLHEAAAAAVRVTERNERNAAAGAARATTGQANTAVAHLDSRGMREVLNFLALHDPDAVLLAVRETGA